MLRRKILLGILFAFPILILLELNTWSPRILRQKIYTHAKELSQKIIKEPISIFEDHTLEEGSNLYQLLTSLGLSKEDYEILVQNLSSFVNFTQLSLHTKIVIERAPKQSAIISIRLVLNPIDHVLAKRNQENPGEGAWTIEKETRPIALQSSGFNGVIHNSLWESFDEAGLSANMVSEFAEILSSQIDFNREVQRGDRWYILVDEKTVDEQRVGFGPMHLVWYQKSDNSPLVAIRFEPKSGVEAPSYFTPSGENLKSFFLKSPIKFARVSSPFQKNRFHPILGYSKPHNGVDYAAPKGTPIFSVADGTITEFGRKGPSGNMIKIRHNSQYETAYKHLSGFAPKMRLNKNVQRGEVIGYVGATGLATGAHLHFEFFDNGKYVDPLGKRFPYSKPLSPHQKNEFELCSTKFQHELVQRFPQVEFESSYFGREKLTRESSKNDGPS